MTSRSAPSHFNPRLGSIGAGCGEADSRPKTAFQSQAWFDWRRPRVQRQSDGNRISIPGLVRLAPDSLHTSHFHTPDFNPRLGSIGAAIAHLLDLFLRKFQSQAWFDWRRMCTHSCHEQNSEISIPGLVRLALELLRPDDFSDPISIPGLVRLALRMFFLGEFTRPGFQSQAWFDWREEAPEALGHQLLHFNPRLG